MDHMWTSLGRVLEAPMGSALLRIAASLQLNKLLDRQDLRLVRSAT